MSQNKIKVVLIGDANVGKSNIFSRLTSNRFEESGTPTLGAAFKLINLDINSTVYNIEIWDTAGQERYHSLSKSYSRDANVVILVYDITDQSSFEALKTWHKLLQTSAHPSAVFGIFANKQDLNFEGQVSAAEAQALSNKINALYKPTSAKENFGVQEGLCELCKIYLNNIGEYIHKDSFKVENRRILRRHRRRECCK